MAATLRQMNKPFSPFVLSPPIRPSSPISVAQQAIRLRAPPWHGFGAPQSRPVAVAVATYVAMLAELLYSTAYVSALPGLCCKQTPTKRNKIMQLP